MARILFTISLALAALSVVVSGAPTTNNKRCEGGDCEVFVERSDEGKRGSSINHKKQAH